LPELSWFYQVLHSACLRTLALKLSCRLAPKKTSAGPKKSHSATRLDGHVLLKVWSGMLRRAAPNFELQSAVYKFSIKCKIITGTMW
jgi:hypothetical protein